MANFNMSRDVTGSPAYAPPFPLIGTSTTLTANIAQSYTVPSTFKEYIAIFSIDPGTRIWIASNATAVGPTSSFANTVSTLNPTARFVNAGDVLSFISSDTNAMVGVNLYGKF
jgi:hypothetical protein